MYKETITEKTKNSIDFIEFKELPNLNHEVLSTSIAQTTDLSLLKPLVIDENVQTILKKVISRILDEGDKQFIDFRGNYNTNLTSFDNDFDQTRKIISKIIDMSDSDTSLITNARLAVQLQDHSSFNIVPSTNRTLSAAPYKIGKLAGRDLWIDPFMNWTDNFILFIHNVNIEISDMSESIVNESTFAPRIKFELKLKFDLVDPKCLFVFTDEYQRNASELISKERDEKIDYILGENSGSEQNIKFRIHNNN
jgi:hypothetical protein